MAQRLSRKDFITRTRTTIPHVSDDESLDIDDASSVDSKLDSVERNLKVQPELCASRCDSISPIIRKRSRLTNATAKQTALAKRSRPGFLFEIDDDSSSVSSCSADFKGAYCNKVVIESDNDTLEAEKTTDLHVSDASICDSSNSCLPNCKPLKAATPTSVKHVDKTFLADDAVDISIITNSSLSHLGDESANESWRMAECKFREDLEQHAVESLSASSVEEADEPSQYEKHADSPFVDDASDNGVEKHFGDFVADSQSQSTFEIDEADEGLYEEHTLVSRLDDESAISASTLPEPVHVSALTVYANVHSSASRSPQRVLRCVRDGLVERLQRTSLRERAETSVWSVRVVNLLSTLRSFSNRIRRVASEEQHDFLSDNERRLHELDEELQEKCDVARLSGSLDCEVLLRTARTPIAVYGTVLSAFVCEVLHDFRHHMLQKDDVAMQRGDSCCLLLAEDVLRNARMTDVTADRVLIVRASWKVLHLTAAESKQFGLPLPPLYEAPTQVAVYTDIRCVKCID